MAFLPNVRFSGATFHTLQQIPEGDAGTRATLRVMRDVVRAWRVAPEVRQLAKQITANCEAKAFACHAMTLHAWVRDNIKYLPDVADVETIQTPDLTLRDRVGDCDDQAVLLASLLQSIGHPVRFVAVGMNAGGPFSHVYAETRIGGYWRAAETTEPWQFGRSPGGVRRRMFETL